ncbi:hypothetical protein Sjap_004231 [Stephania japonica]|uniref:Uncharacterized protein n=1 Tax=Stephania japonica TaxID=461633 RepID=A0AAP0K1X0_9MAGN
MAYGLFRLSAGLCRTFTISGTDGALLDQLVFMLGGFTIHPSSLAGSLAAVFQGIDANKYCNWCHDINCVPSSFWSCSEKVLPCECWMPASSPEAVRPVTMKARELLAAQSGSYSTDVLSIHVKISSSTELPRVYTKHFAVLEMLEEEKSAIVADLPIVFHAFKMQPESRDWSIIDYYLQMKTPVMIVDNHDSKSIIYFHERCSVAVC